MHDLRVWWLLAVGLAGCARCASAPAEAVVFEEKEGTGAPIGPSMLATVHYTLARADGGVIDSNVGREGFNLRVGKGFAMPGFERYVPGMKLNGARRVTAPASRLLGEALPEGLKADDMVTLSMSVDDLVFMVEP